MKIAIRHQILELTDAGIGGLEIASSLGLDLAEVNNVIKRFGSSKSGHVSDREGYRRIFELRANGMDADAIAEELNYPLFSVVASIERDKSKIKNDSRASECLQLYKQGESLEVIGSKFGITRERVRQITKKQFGFELGYGPMEQKVRKDEITKLHRELVASSRLERRDDAVSQRVEEAKRKGIEPEYFDSVTKFSNAIGVNPSALKELRPDIYRIVAKNAYEKSKKWSWYYDSCRNCGTTSVKHRGYGYCNDCYTKSPEFKASQQRSHQKNRDKILANNKKYSAKYMSRPDVMERLEREYDEKYFGGNRKAALERDGYQCKGCGMSVEVKDAAGRAKARVWHLGAKDDHTLDNLGTYCQRCLYKYRGINPFNNFGRVK